MTTSVAHGTAWATEEAHPFLPVSSQETGPSILVMNRGPKVVYLGGLSVTPNGSTGGVPVQANQTVTVPAMSGMELYCVTAPGQTAEISWLYGYNQ